MSAKYKCDFCGYPLTGKSNNYCETKRIVKKTYDERYKTIIGCLTIGPVLGVDICGKCFQEIRDEFIQELVERKGKIRGGSNEN